MVEPAPFPMLEILNAVPTMKRQSSVSTTCNTIIPHKEDERKRGGGGRRTYSRYSDLIPSVGCVYVYVKALKEYGALQIRMKPRAWIYIEDLHRVA